MRHLLPIVAVCCAPVVFAGAMDGERTLFLVDGLAASRIRLSSGQATVVDTVRSTQPGQADWEETTKVFLVFDYAAGRYRLDRERGDNVKKFVITPNGILDYDNFSRLVTRFGIDHKPVQGLELFDVRAIGLSSDAEYRHNAKMEKLIDVLRRSEVVDIQNEDRGVIKLIGDILINPKVRQTIWIDVENGFVPIKFDRQILPKEDASGRTIATGAFEWTEVNDAWVPRHALLTSIDNDRVISNELTFDWRLVNEEISEEHFTVEGIQPPPGTFIGNAKLSQGNWPRWRGPGDDGSAVAGEYPESCDPKQAAWKAELPTGCSTPIVWEELIVVTGGDAGRNTVIALDWQGKERWRTVLGAENPGKHRNGSGANSSPVTDGKFVFAYFKSGELAGLTIEGKRLWSTNLQERFAKDTLYWDVGTSPVLTNDAVVVAVMHSGESYLAAFDKASGDLRWKVARNYETPVEGDHSYATPIVVEQGGRQTIVVWGAEHLTGHTPEDGRVLWSCGGFNPERNANWVAVASAVVAGDLAIVPYGRGSRLAAVKMEGSGDVTTSKRLWTREDTGSFVPTPAVADGKLYLVRDEGEVECLDPQTGQTLWSDRFPKHRAKFYSSPTIAGGKLYAAREDGVVLVADVRDGFQLLSENDIGERVIASPVAVAGRLLIRGERHLYCIGR